MTLTSSFKQFIHKIAKVTGWTSLFLVILPLVAAVLTGSIGQYYGDSETVLSQYANFMVNRPLFIIGFVTIVIWMITIYVKEKQVE